MAIEKTVEIAVERGVETSVEGGISSKQLFFNDTYITTTYAPKAGTRSKIELVINIDSGGSGVRYVLSQNATAGTTLIVDATDKYQLAKNGTFDTGIAASAKDTDLELLYDWAGAPSGEMIFTIDGGADLTAFTQGAGTETGVLIIGSTSAAPPSSAFRGVIKEVKVYEWSGGYGAALHHWKINEGGGTNIIDYGTAGADATLTIGSGSWI